MKVVVLHDLIPEGAAPDLYDNLIQAEQISQTLMILGHQTTNLTFDPRDERTSSELLRLTPDIVFNLVEAPLGQGRLIDLGPELLERLGFSYAGSPASALKMTSNKLEAKRYLQAAGLPTPNWIELEANSRGDIRAERFIIKSVWEHASFGLEADAVMPGDDLERVRAEIARRSHLHGGDCFAEVFIDGREFSMALLADESGPEVLPLSEIIFEDFSPDMPKVVGYKAKWLPESFEYTHTPRTFDLFPQDKALHRELIDLALRCWVLFGLRGWARVDYRVDDRSRPYILEVNANPCLAQDAGYMATANEAGLDMKVVVARIIKDCVHPRGL